MQVYRDYPPHTAMFSPDGLGTIGSGGCTRCGRDRKKNDPGVIDIDVQPGLEGTVVLCWPCSQEIGSLAGMATPEKVAKYEAEIAALKQQVADRDSELEAHAHLRAALDAAVKVGA